MIADRGFPFCEIETVDISLVDDVPTVLQVLAAIRPNFVVGHAWMADEFLQVNGEAVVSRYAEALGPVLRRATSRTWRSSSACPRQSD